MITEAFAKFTAETGYDDIPEEVRACAKERILDTVGAALAGAANWEYKENFLEACRGFGSGNCAVISSPRKEFPLPGAAMINATLAHSIELDDGHKNAGVHAGAAIVPAALTLGRAAGKSGKEIITAVVLGYDLVYRLASAMAPDQIRKGFHPSGNDDTIGVTAAAGKLWGLNESQLANGFGLSALYASGLMEATVNGQASKCIQVGNAVYSGIAAAMYAKNDMEGTLTAFEGKTGFLRAKSREITEEEVCRGLGENFLITDTYCKLYPTARHSQPAIEAVLDLSEEHGFGWEEVEQVWVGTHQVAKDMTGMIVTPRDSGEAKFSLAYGVALALHEHAFGIVHLSEKYTQDPVNKSLAERVTIVVDPEVQALYPGKRGAKVKVTLKDGRIFEKEVYDLKGSPANPVGWNEIEKKFRANAGALLSEEQTERVINMIAKLETLDDVDSLMEILELQQN